MPIFKHILFPVDFSDRCYAIRPFVASMARQHDARVTLMHVIQIPTGWYSGMETPYPILFDISAMKQKAQKELDVFFESPEHAIKKEFVVEDGDPAEHIVSYAEKTGVDLVMMPTHGYGRFRNLLLGSVTSKVLHDAKCAVWTAAHMEDLATAGHPECQSILCAVDLEKENVRLIRAAGDLARDYAAKLRLVHAVSATEALPDKYLNSGFREFLFQTNREAIANLQEQASTNFEVCMEGGAVSAVVGAAARHHDADLVIIGRGRMYERFGHLRTNAYAIIRDAPCPVLSL